MTRLTTTEIEDIPAELIAVKRQIHQLVRRLDFVLDTLDANTTRQRGKQSAKQREEPAA